MRQDGEASVEQILESIKRVIARDNRAEELADRQSEQAQMSDDGTLTPDSAEMPDPASEDEVDDVLELSVYDVEPVAEAQDDGVRDDRDTQTSREADRDETETLIRPETRQSMRDNLTLLAMMAEPESQPAGSGPTLRAGETSLEGLAREMMRPMLAEWLDANLPAMVERMVQEEINRITGKRR